MKRKRFAFTLPEVLIGLLVISCGIIPIFYVFARGNAGTVQTKDEVLAQNYASDLLSYALTKKYDDPFLAEGRHSLDSLTITPKSGAPVTLEVEKDFSRFLNVTEWHPPAGMDWDYSYKIIVAEVVWKSAGVSRKLQLSSLVYQPRN